MKESNLKEIKKSVLSSRLASHKWAENTKDRIIILSNVYSELGKRKNELALLTTKEIGMPINQSLADVDSGLAYFKWYLDNAEKYISPEITHDDDKSCHTVFYEPIGVAAVISPWNFPFSNFVWGVVQNLIVGNTVVYKHSEECMLFGKKIEEILSLSLPKGVFIEIYGGSTVGHDLVNQNIDIICFTGSTSVGQKLYEIASKKMIKVVLELGGSAPGIIFEDANLESILETVYISKFLNCGQVCDGLKRLIVHESVFNDVIRKLTVLLEKKKVGNPEENDTDVGPLVSKKQLKTLEKQVKDAITKGAKIIIGGKSLKGNYYLPTLISNIKPNMKIWTEEVFGPVLPIVSFKSEEEAIRLANDTIYGLGCYIFTENKEKSLRVAKQIKSGMVAINNSTYIMPFNPFGGYKKSGIGREHGKYGLRELCQIKIITEDKTS